ncbi:MAG: hypothetical protein EOP54_07765 [Sphingobacteriales bacterium]|nr:MAG: hypothetical protein EOP54_07765 [Sphingobacteriales bacterium]
MITLLHHPGCSKSSCALDYSQLFPGLDIRTRAYLQEPLNKEELLQLLQQLQLPVSAIVRTTDKDFVAQFGTEVLAADAYLDILVKQPQFLQRPILIDGNEAIIGRPPEVILDYLKRL